MTKLILLMATILLLPIETIAAEAGPAQGGGGPTGSYAALRQYALDRGLPLERYLGLLKNYEQDSDRRFRPDFSSVPDEVRRQYEQAKAKEQELHDTIKEATVEIDQELRQLDDEKSRLSSPDYFLLQILGQNVLYGFPGAKEKYRRTEEKWERDGKRKNEIRARARELRERKREITKPLQEKLHQFYFGKSLRIKDPYITEQFNKHQRQIREDIKAAIDREAQ